MTTFIEGTATVGRGASEILNGLVTIGTPKEDVPMGVLHQKRCPQMESNQDNDSKLLPKVLHLPIECMYLPNEMQEFSFVAFLPKNP